MKAWWIGFGGVQRLEAEGYIGIMKKKIIGAIGIIQGLYSYIEILDTVLKCFFGLCWIVKLGEPPRVRRGA